jgi:hypothetical protein
MLQESEMSKPNKQERLMQMVASDTLDEFMKAISDDDEVREWAEQLFGDTIKETVEIKDER